MAARIVRKNFLIDRRFQIGLAFKFFVCLVLVAAASGWAVYYAVWKAVVVELHGVYLSRLYHAIGRRLLLYAIGGIFSLSVLSIFFSHKIAGPIYRMRKTVDEFVEKDEKPGVPITLRKGDFFRDLAESLNRLFNKFAQGNRT